MPTLHRFPIVLKGNATLAGNVLTISGLTAVVDDTSPTLGGDLECNGKFIRGGAGMNWKVILPDDQNNSDGAYFHMKQDESGGTCEIAITDGAFDGADLQFSLVTGYQYIWRIAGGAEMLLSAAGLDVTDAVRAGGLRADADPSGVASTTTLTNASDTNSTTTASISGPTSAGTKTKNSGHIVLKLGTTTIYVPYFQ